MKYAEEKQYTIYNASCLDVMDSMEENSIDCIVTDPPYEIGFMNKGWDNTGIAFNIETWQKALRILKPGGYLLAFNHSRTFHRMMVAIEDAGFELRDTIMYMYGSGFPKSHNLEKALNKLGQCGIMEVAERNDNNEKETKQNTKHDMRPMSQTNISQTINIEDKQREILFKSLSKQSIYGTMQGEKSKESVKNGKESCLERWYYLQAIEGQLSRCKICKMSERIFIDGEERWLCNGTQINNGAELTKVFDSEGSCPSYRPQSNKQQNRKLNVIPNQFITQKIRRFNEEVNGYGTALKPAFEPIVMARKPFRTSVAENVLTYGVGGINIDECRIGHNGGTTRSHQAPVADSGWRVGHAVIELDLGRFPANIIHDGSEEACSGFPDTGAGGSIAKPYKMNNQVYGDYGNCKEWESYGDEGSASRYFYTAKASVKDRDDGLDEFMKTTVDDGCDKSIDNAYQRGETLRKNIHPTVKPTDLMQYLVRLVAPKGATVLDIFMGSGSTGKACMIENTERNANYHFIGIDLEKEYCEIAQARIEWGINFRELEDEHVLYEDDGTAKKVIQDKFDLFGDDNVG